MRVAIFMDDYDPCLSVNRFSWKRWAKKGQLLMFSFILNRTLKGTP